MLSQERERQGVVEGCRGGMREDDTGPQELITLNNGEQIKNNLCRMGEISRGSSESETFIGHKIYLQNLTYIM